MEEKIKKQVSVIDSLLRDKHFCLSLARDQHTAYYAGIGQPVPPFLTPEEKHAVIHKSAKVEDIASNLAGFYAVECGIDFLCNQTKEKPSAWLQQISQGTNDEATALLLNRFANATWKAGQPFKGFEKIARPVFRSASFLSPAEIDKDRNQIKMAATKLLSSLANVADSGTDIQMKTIRGLLQSQSYAWEIASAINRSYSGDNDKNALAISKNEDIITRSVLDQKIATNLAGLYALESCTDYLVSTRNVLPSELLKSITDNCIGEEDRNLYNRFANATWKASQPFRGLERIERDIFTPFYFLKKEDIDKDWIQIKAAAKKLLSVL